MMRVVLHPDYKERNLFLGSILNVCHNLNNVYFLKFILYITQLINLN